MDYITTVRVLLAGSRTPLNGVKVALYDRDENSEDDALGVGHTNQFGEVDFHYSTRDFADGFLGTDDQGGVRLRGRDTVPDLYAIVYNQQDEAVISTREKATENKAALNILIEIDETIARAHGLVEA